MENIIVDQNHAVTIITLNRDDKRNAFNRAMSAEIMDAVVDAEQNQQRAIVLKSNHNSRIWSSGHDIAELVNNKGLATDAMFDLVHKIISSPLPVIAVVDGVAFAGAAHLLIACDIVLATNDASVVMTANKMGVPFLPKNYSNWLSNVGAHKIKEVFFTAAPLSASDAYVAGIFNHVSTLDQIQMKLNDILNHILENSADGIANTKLQVNTLARSTSLSYDEYSKIEADRLKIFGSNEFKRRLQAMLDRFRKKKPQR